LKGNYAGAIKNNAINTFIFTVRRLQVSCFETARHAVFIVSDLPEGDNLVLARALAPSVFATSCVLKMILDNSEAL
jgi:hypothetical protein